MADLRERTHTLEDTVAEELGLEDVGVSHRYESLFEYLRGDRGLNKEVRKKLHEYTVFLHILPEWLDASDLSSEKKISYTPSRGRGSQISWIPSLFVEPHLPPYPEEDFWNQYKGEYRCLQDPSGKGRTHHTRPDELLTVKGADDLPWTANSSPQPVDQSRLMTMCANGLYEKVSDELGASEIPSNYAECTSLVQTEAETESTSELYEKWEGFEEKAEYIIECKHEPFGETDYSQILWYGLVYDTDVVLVSKHPVNNPQFSRDVENLPVNVSIVSGVDVLTEAEEARSKISKAFQ